MTMRTATRMMTTVARRSQGSSMRMYCEPTKTEEADSAEKVVYELAEKTLSLTVLQFRLFKKIISEDAGHDLPQLKTMSPKAIPPSQSIPSAVRKSEGGPVVLQRSPARGFVGSLVGDSQALNNVANITNGAPRGSTTSHSQTTSAFVKAFSSATPAKPVSPRLASSRVAPASSVPSPVRAQPPPRKAIDSQRERGSSVPPVTAVKSTSQRREVTPKPNVPNGVNSANVRSSSAEKERGKERQNSHSAATASVSRPAVFRYEGTRRNSPPRAKPTTTAPLHSSNLHPERKKNKKAPKQRIGNGPPTNLSTSGRTDQRSEKANTEPQHSRPGSVAERIRRLTLSSGLSQPPSLGKPSVSR